MAKYVALLRGVNVGGNNKVEMSKLKECFESLGFKNVSTYINSGNVIFETTQKSTDKLSEDIEKVLKKTFGFSIEIVVRDSKSIEKVCKVIPVEWENNTEQKTDVFFLQDDHNSKKGLNLLSITPKIDSLKYVDGAIVWNIKRSNYSKSGMRKLIGTTLYKNMTARNVNTVRKLNELMNADK